MTIPSSVPVAAVVKYNPCSRFALLGKPCRIFESGRICNHRLDPSGCPLRGRRSWLNEAVAGRIKSFFPNPIHLLEVPGTILILYHRGMRKIIGESKIIRCLKRRNEYHYEFDRLHLYPNPVEPTIIKSARALRSKGALNGRWTVIYVPKRVVMQIRTLGGWKESSDSDVNKDLELLEHMIAEWRFEKVRRFRPTRMVRMREQLDRWENELTQQLGLPMGLMKAARSLTETAAREKELAACDARALAAAAIYIAARQRGYPLSLRNLERHVGVRSRKLNAALLSLRSRLKVEVPGCDLTRVVNVGAMRLGLEQTTILRAQQTAADTRIRTLLSGRTASSIAAAITTLAIEETGFQRLQFEIAGAFGVSEVTLRNCVQMLRKSYPLVPDELPQRE